jgi:hypothetical protein
MYEQTAKLKSQVALLTDKNKNLVDQLARAKKEVSAKKPRPSSAKLPSTTGAQILSDDCP